MFGNAHTWVQAEFIFMGNNKSIFYWTIWGMCKCWAKLIFIFIYALDSHEFRKFMSKGRGGKMKMLEIYVATQPFLVQDCLEVDDLEN